MTVKFTPKGDGGRIGRVLALFCAAGLLGPLAAPLNALADCGGSCCAPLPPAITPGTVDGCCGPGGESCGVDSAPDAPPFGPAATPPDPKPLPLAAAALTSFPTLTAGIPRAGTPSRSASAGLGPPCPIYLLNSSITC